VQELVRVVAGRLGSDNYNTGATGSLVWYGGGTASKFNVTSAGNATFAGLVNIPAAADGTKFTITSSAGSNHNIIEMGQLGSDGFLDVSAAGGGVVSHLSGYTGYASYFLSQVGIGTASPTNAKLVISDTGSNKISIDGGTSQNGMRWEAVGGANGFYLFNGTFGTAGFGLYNINTAQALLWIQNGGNVGIGTTSPSSKLQIQANQHATNPGGKNYTGSAINADGGDIATGKLFLQGYQNTANDLCGFNNEANRVVLYNYTDGRHLQLWNHTGDTSIPNGSVGIGTTSPSTKLVVAQSNVTEPSGVDANTSILIKNNTWSGMTLLATSSTGSFLTFGDENAGFAGRIQYIHSNDNMIFETAATERMRILGDGSQTQIKGKHGGGADLLLYNTDVTLATDQMIGRLGFYKTDGSGSNVGVSSSIQARATNSGSGSYMSFHTDGETPATQEAERMRITSSGKTLMGITSEQNAGKLQMQSGGFENGGTLDIVTGGWYRYYTRVCHNATSASTAGYWHIKTNIIVNTNVMFMAKFYGYIYGSAQVLDLTHAGYAYSGSNSIINQGTTNNGSDPNASSAIYSSATGNKVTFRIAFGTGSTFSTYFCGVMMDMAFPAPAGQGHDFEIEAQTFSQNTTVY